MGIVEITCPDCGGQLHCESFVGNQGNGKEPYSQYFCVGDTEYHIEFDASSNRGHGCGFLAKSKGKSGNKKYTLKSDELEYWDEWLIHKEKFE